MGKGCGLSFQLLPIFPTPNGCNGGSGKLWGLENDSLRLEAKRGWEGGA